jgi:hypothetical protein
MRIGVALDDRKVRITGTPGALIFPYAIRIFDLPYIFANFALQFPEKQSENDSRWRILAALLAQEEGPAAKMTKAQNKYHLC